MDCVYDPLRLREEAVLQLVCGSDPVLGAYYYRRSIQVIECQLGDVGSEGPHEGVSLAGIAGDHDTAGLLYGLDDLCIVERYQRI